MTQARALTGSELLSFEGKSLFVLNTSDRGGNSRSELLMTFNIKGQSRTVTVPNTWIPIDLTQQVPDVKQIIENDDFMTHFRRKRLAVIETEVAEQALEEADAVEEYNRVHDIKSRTDNGDRFDITIGSHNAGDDKRKNRVMASVKVLSIVNKENLSENNKLASLRNIKAELKADDYRYILNQPKTDENEKLKSWASAQLSAL